ncbi:MAG TPA: hypothetical protein VHP38_07850 [Ruminiclostridium sp.]|nr:hypothetical protein [Ruminiclostridium sp.]
MKINLKRNREQENNTDRTSSLEKILFRICIIFFIALVSVQIILAIPSVKTRLNITDKSIGIPLGSDEYLYGRGIITLAMLGEKPDTTVKILVNGVETAMFEKLKVPVNVNDGDVIEIDASGSISSHIIKVENVSSNIDSKCLNANTNVESNIRKLVKVKFG